MTPIDLRSDTVTRPTDTMLDRMRYAELGDDSRDGDPTVQALEAYAAQRAGKEAGLFVSSGTMGNLVALLAHTGRGGEVVAEAGSHIYRQEMGGIATLAGLFHRAIPGRRGQMDLEILSDTINPRLTSRQLGTALICMEQTHNDAGGAVLPLEHMAAVHDIGRSHGIPVHTDGARLFNAAVALGVDVDRITAHTDTATFCVSKGLSAPIGSVLVGPAEFVARARGFRRMVGGNLRQAGGLAAAGIVALDAMVDRLTEDHRVAKRLALGLAAIDPRLVDADAVETNIVRIDLRLSGRPAAQWAQDLKAQGVLAGPWNKWQLRCVTHRHVDAADIDRTIAVFGDLWHRHVGAAGPEAVVA